MGIMSSAMVPIMPGVGGINQGFGPNPGMGMGYQGMPNQGYPPNTGGFSGFGGMGYP